MKIQLDDNQKALLRIIRDHPNVAPSYIDRLFYSWRADQGVEREELFSVKWTDLKIELRELGLIEKEESVITKKGLDYLE
jgi:hypothetical protein